MVEAATPITNTTRYPAYDDKVNFMNDMIDNLEQGGNSKEKWYEIIYRLSNTTTSDWTTPSYRHDD